MIRTRLLQLGLLNLGLLVMTSCNGGSSGDANGTAVATSSVVRPAVVSGSPSKVTGTEQTLELVFTHPEGADKIATVQLMISPTLNSTKSCWMEYVPRLGTVRMMDGSGKGKAGSSAKLTNSQCSIDESQLKHSVEGNTLNLSVPVQLTPEAENVQNIFAIASAATEHSGWKTVGVWVRGAPTTVTPAGGH
jgi:hypothetical protein